MRQIKNTIGAKETLAVAGDVVKFVIRDASAGVQVRSSIGDVFPVQRGDRVTLKTKSAGLQIYNPNDVAVDIEFILMDGIGAEYESSAGAVEVTGGVIALENGAEPFFVVPSNPPGIAPPLNVEVVSVKREILEVRWFSLDVGGFARTTGPENWPPRKKTVITHCDHPIHLSIAKNVTTSNPDAPSDNGYLMRVEPADCPVTIEGNAALEVVKDGTGGLVNGYEVNGEILIESPGTGPT
ncbi:hypothetical protein HF888_07800 [Bermanella marisrubri]|uniref:Uncharacterized protein n=1 Tax=Bermanella marisrubri TaxID=207949 RepID=Q1N4P6_9GAMM|nr:hypothetical protein [Bermanella marisrubri]EAT13382.1 hypothetical protein RED65_01440 [Oceanobacter sp. RED65] [Bermanella marisrubri]QIZ84136.1 hypothetical protein HF888_07800 [Bermanella marisrubri]